MASVSWGPSGSTPAHPTLVVRLPLAGLTVPWGTDTLKLDREAGSWQTGGDMGQKLPALLLSLHEWEWWPPLLGLGLPTCTAAV